DNRRPNRSDGGQDLYRTGSGAVISSGLLWVSPEQVCLTGGWGDPREVLEVRLGHRVRHPQGVRRTGLDAVTEGGAQTRQGAMGGVVYRAVVASALCDGGRDDGPAQPGGAARLGHRTD